MPLVFSDRATANTQMTLPDMLDMNSMTAPGSIRGAAPHNSVHARPAGTP